MDFQEYPILKKWMLTYNLFVIMATIITKKQLFGLPMGD